jgi:pilus assembly protein CpaF
MAEKTANEKKIAKPTAKINNEDSVTRKEKDRIALELLQQVVDNLAGNEIPNELSDEWKRALVRRGYEYMENVITYKNLILSLNDKREIMKMVMDDITGYGPINDMLRDPSVSEIMVNGPDHVYLERQGKLYLTDIRFRDNDHVVHVIDKICSPLGRRIDEASPMVDARLPDGSRVNAVISPVAFKGACLTIRKFAPIPFTDKDLFELGTYSTEMLYFLRSCIRGRVNIIISGGSGCGKTTLLNALSAHIPAGERIITIEDTAELQLKQEHVITLETRPRNIEGNGLIGIRDIVINALKMRPDRIIVGDVRSGEALDMLQAMSSGHYGSVSTLHASTPRSALFRLETMALMAGVDLPHRAIREQVASAIELIIHLTRFPDGTRKVTRISELLGLEGNNYCMQDLFIFKSNGINESGNYTGQYEATGIIPSIIEKLKLAGEKIQHNIFASKENFTQDQSNQGRGSNWSSCQC